MIIYFGLFHDRDSAPNLATPTISCLFPRSILYLISLARPQLTICWLLLWFHVIHLWPFLCFHFTMSQAFTEVLSDVLPSSRSASPSLHRSSNCHKSSRAPRMLLHPSPTVGLNFPNCLVLLVLHLTSNHRLSNCQKLSQAPRALFHHQPTVLLTVTNCLELIVLLISARLPFVALLQIVFGSSQFAAPPRFDCLTVKNVLGPSLLQHRHHNR